MFRTGLPPSCCWQKVVALACALIVAAGVARAGRAQTAHFSYLQSTVATGLNAPQGVAVDSGGNVYVAEFGNNRVLKETASAGAYTQSVVASGLIYADGVAVDASGNVYIADAGQAGILKETLTAGTYSLSPTHIGTGFNPIAVAANNSASSLYATAALTLYVEQLVSPGSYAQSSTGIALPEGVAVDSSNHYIYVVDRQYGQVLKGTLVSGTYAAGPIVTGLNSPNGVAVDSNGNVYVVDQGADTVYKETPPVGTGTYTQSVVASGLTYPYGIAVDANGVLYVSDAYGGGRVLKYAQRAVSFGSQGVGSASSAQSLSFTFDSAGTLGSYAVLTQGAVGLDFIDAGGGSCQAATAYTTGAMCTVNVSFTPTAAGARYGAVTLYDSLGNPIATAYVYGTGTGPQMAFAPATQSAVGSGTMGPLGAAVDSAGNVYISDTNNGRILLETLTAGTYTQTQIITGLRGPYGVAVDGAGNLYIGEIYYYNPNGKYGRVLKETPLPGGHYGQSVIADAATSPYAMDYPNAVAVDGAGNLYIANTDASQVIKETLQPSGSYVESLLADASTVPYAINNPKGIAVDGSGNLYVSNTKSFQVLKESLSGSGTYTQSLVATVTSGGYDSPFEVAVDGSGNVYVTDAANNQLLRETPSAGSYTQSMAWTVYQPYGVAVDSSGNPIVTSPNTGTGAVFKIDVADPPSVAFAGAVVGASSSDSPQTVTVTNVGNAALSFAVPGTAGTLNPSVDPNFSYGASSTCMQTGFAGTSFTLAAGVSCTESISFAPQMAGVIAGSAVNTDDNLNVANATQAIALTGTATAGAPSVSVAPASVPYGTATATLTATVAYGGTAPIGTVTFTLNASSQAGVCSVSGGTRTCTATYSVGSLPAGSYSVAVSEAADANYSAASGIGSLAITQVAPSVSIATQSIVYGTPQAVLLANIAYTGSAAPSGVVTIAFNAGAAVTASCSGTLSPLSCTVSVATTALSAGNYTITAAVAADINYTAASGTGVLTVTKATPVITWAQPAAVAVGTALSGAQLNATASVAGSFAYVPAAGTVLTAGSQILSVTFTPADLTDYTTASQQVTLAVLPYAAAPIFMPGTGAYTTPQTVTISDAVANATIYYTTDGSTPTTASSRYVAPIPVPATETIEAIATASGYEPSAIGTAVVTIYKAPVCTLTVQGTSTAGSVIAIVSCTDPQGQALTSTLSWGDGTTTPATQGRNTHTYTSAGTYTVVLTSTDTSGLQGSAQQQITPNQTPVCSLGVVQGAAATYAVSVTAACTDPQSQPLSLSIDWGDGSQSPATNNAVNTHTYANPSASNTTPYIVDLTAVDTPGLIGSTTQPVTILPAAAQAAPGDTSKVSVAAPSVTSTPVTTQVTFICSSVSTTVNGQTVTNALPSQYGITCSAPTVPVSSAQNGVTVNIQTTSASATTSARNRADSPAGVYYAMVLPLPALASFALGLLAPGFTGRRRRQAAAMGMIVVACFALSSCGGSFTPPPVIATPVGNYYITIVEVSVTTPAPSGFVQTSLIVPLPIGVGGS